MKIKGIAIVLWALLSAAIALAKEPVILPATFNGWQLEKASVKSGTDPASADGADGAVLKEYGFSSFETGNYTRNGRHMQIKAARFNDASGAFGAFSYYVQPQMQQENIGDRGASNNKRILFSRSNILVDAALEQVTAMSAADLRSLADALPKAKGTDSTLPSLPNNLPKQSLMPRTVRYIEGPIALERLGVPLPASLVNFPMGAEVALAKYRTSNGEAAMTLVSYPTPQIASERMKAFQSAGLSGGPLYFKRSGPFVAVISGNIPESEAQSLLASVNYDADVTWNQATKANPKDDPYKFIFALVMLVVIVVAAALIFGFAFGGFRVLARRYFPNRVFGRAEDVEFIQLNLK